MKTIDEIKKEVAKECAEEHFEVIFEAEISVGDYKQARRLWNEVGDRYIKQFENGDYTETLIQICYKTNEPCKYDCTGLCRESF